MIQEEKQLLLKDICARLPYGVKINFWKSLSKGKYERCVGVLVGIDNRLPVDELILKLGHSFVTDSIETSKPYLRPMSSMTEEEVDEWAKASNMKFDMEDGFFDAYDAHLSVDWLNKNIFDFRGLIPMGLALEAPEGMYEQNS